MEMENGLIYMHMHMQILVWMCIMDRKYEVMSFLCPRLVLHAVIVLKCVRGWDS